MTEFKIGDWVEVGIDVQRFEKEARHNSSTRSYINYLKEGGIAKVIRVDERSVRLNVDTIDEESNWFEKEWFAFGNEKLAQIKKESQRL